MENENKWMNANTFFMDYDVIQNTDFLILKYLDEYSNTGIKGINLQFMEGIDDSVLIRFLEDRKLKNIFNWLSLNNPIDSDNNTYNTWKETFPINSNDTDGLAVTDFIKGFINFCYTKKSVKQIYIRTNIDNTNRIECLREIFGDKFNLIELVDTKSDYRELLKKSDVIITSDEDLLLNNMDIVKDKVNILPNQSFRFKKDKSNNVEIIKSINEWEFRDDILVSFVDLYNITKDMFNYG